MYVYVCIRIYICIYIHGRVVRFGAIDACSHMLDVVCVGAGCGPCWRVLAGGDCVLCVLATELAIVGPLLHVARVAVCWLFLASAQCMLVRNDMC